MQSKVYSINTSINLTQGAFMAEKLTVDPVKDDVLRHELTEPATKLLNRHIPIAPTWVPHEQIPYDYIRPWHKDTPWSPEEYPLDDGVRSALYVNLLTEDNLPYYSATILNMADPDHPFAEWGRRWTAEESRHSEVIRDWIHASRALDPKLLDEGRMMQMTKAEVPVPDSLAELLTYTSFQELATQVAHRNTARHIDKVGRAVLGKVAGDEGRHYNFYSDLAKAGFEIDPSTMMIAVMRRLRGFKMPGTGIPNFAEHSQAIADAGIYDADHFLHQVVEPVLAKWDLDSVTGLSPEGEQAYLRIQKNVSALGRGAALSAVRAEKQAELI